jgi:peptide/nickel transport system substrate-binding protein
MIKKKALAVAMAVSSISLGIVAVAAGTSGASGGIANATTLTEETDVGVTFTDNFNPYNTNSVSNTMSLESLTYEPLIEFDSLKAGVQYPWLATSEVFSNGGKTVTFAIRSGAKWSDGQAVTPADVAYTFNLINSNPSMNTLGLPALSQPASVSGNNVVLTYITPQYANQVAIGSMLTLPEHIWSKFSNPAQQVITNPIGDGPYTLKSYNSQVIKFQASKTFWGGTPAVTYVDVPAIASNQAASEALAAHTLDWAGNDIPNINSTYVSLDPTHNKYYYAPGSTVTLWFNVGSKAPDAKNSCLTDAVFRKAVSEAMDRSQLSTLGETGYEPPATSSSGLMPSQAAYEGSFKNDLSATSASKSTVDATLSAGGFTFNSAGNPVVGGAAAAATGLASGTVCGNFQIEDPAAFSDYASDAQLIATSLGNDGILATADPVNTSTWFSDIAAGTFDSAVHWGNGGTNPYTQFQNWLDSSGTANGSADYGSFVNSSAASALSQLAASPVGSANFQAAVTALSTIMSTDVPEAPILYGADWDVYSTARFTGWVTESNPYIYPGPGNPDTLAYVLMKLKPVK